MTLDRLALTVRLPLPPTTNNAYFNSRRGRILTDDARIYKSAVGWLTKVAVSEQGVWPIEPPYDVTLCYYSAGGRRPDAGNVEKLAVDAVFEALGRNDRTIIGLHILMLTDRENPRLDVVLRHAGEG